MNALVTKECEFSHFWFEDSYSIWFSVSHYGIFFRTEIKMKTPLWMFELWPVSSLTLYILLFPTPGLASPSGEGFSPSPASWPQWERTPSELPCCCLSGLTHTCSVLTGQSCDVGYQSCHVFPVCVAASAPRPRPICGAGQPLHKNAETKCLRSQNQVSTVTKWCSFEKDDSICVD